MRRELALLALLPGLAFGQWNSHQPLGIKRATYTLGLGLVEVPTVPSDLVATEVTFDNIPLTWTDGSSDENNFVVERKTGAGDYAVIRTIFPDLTTWADTTTEPSTTYTWRIQACNYGGCSDYAVSNEVTTSAGE